jgi:SAM-dependent methyltransferase
MPDATASTRTTCPVCGGDVRPAGSVASKFSHREFALVRCGSCSYAYVLEPRTDFAELYDEAYYAGRGADALVDYEREMEDPRTVRVYEWRGIAAVIDELSVLAPSTRWLDYGAGLGGLVRYTRATVGCESFGFDEGYGAEQMAARQIPSLTRAEVEAANGTFDVVTAIEVIEHTVDPVELLREVFRALVPGGLVYLTTGNAEPRRQDLTRWAYAKVPDVHVGFFEPATLARALEAAGFEVLWPGFVDGLSDVIRYKVLKTARVHRTNGIERILPWTSLSRIVDRRHHVSAMPAGRRPR